ncbi:GroES-like protein [Sparassis crispa]|uniref:GroES-like protein n=1 Tax=Sparassis crispa TaxID=139825 RepID=A0A401H0X9_9APHY|nr:GroES-like protein [Sparassis crispa]GBE88087.1 GroES-like protein [Sparassis crispa]
MPSEQKALLLQSKQGSLAVGTIDVPKAGPGELLVKTESTALNPVDWKIQSYGIFATDFPAVLGTDAAGIVEEVGEGVSGFAVGDRVLTEGNHDNAHATFQQYFIAVADITAKIPNNISFDHAASLPACVVTAVLGLFNQDDPAKSAALTPFWEESGKGKYVGKPIVVFGGATSVGQYVIQVAKLAGFSPIIATASLHNTDLLKFFGATHVLDRKLSASELVAAVGKITSAPVELVYDAVSESDTQNAAYDVLAPGGTLVIVLEEAVDSAKKVAEKKVVQVYGSGHGAQNRKTAASFFSRFTALLEQGAIKPNRVEVLPNGLAGIVDGLERLKNNQVSGLKLVAHPQEGTA